MKRIILIVLLIELVTACSDEELRRTNHVNNVLKEEIKKFNSGIDSMTTKSSVHFYLLAEKEYQKGNQDISLKHLQQIIKEFPDSPLAGVAKEKIKELQKNNF